MKVDFTFETYSESLKALQRQGFCFQTVEGFMADSLERVVVLRHDVDRLPRRQRPDARGAEGKKLGA